MTVLRNGRLGTGRLVDIDVDGADIVRISEVLPGSGVLRPPAGPDDVDLGERLVLPLLVDGHAHLDKTFLGASWKPHVPGGSVRERIQTEKRLRADIEISVSERARLLAHRMIGFGIGYVRTHVDVDPETGLDDLQAILALRDELQGVLEMEVVAFPQGGVTSRPGSADLLAKALDLGADLIGGLDPADIDEDVDGQLGLIFALAEPVGAGVDIHLHATGETALREYRAIIAATRRFGLHGRVTISHGFGLGLLEPSTRSEIFEQLVEQDISIMTNGPTGPMPPIRDLVARGVTVFAGTDNVRDAWSPFGSGDVLQTAARVAYQSDFRTDDELELALNMVTYAAARVLRIRDYGIAAGGKANLVIVDARSVAEAVADPPVERKTMRDGQWILHRDTSTGPGASRHNAYGSPSRHKWEPTTGQAAGE